jgi:CubicO group peptidase (beta-lactamase class C family)
MPLDNPPGAKVVYSCLGYILLGKLIERVSGLGLDEFAKSRIFKPLDMHETMYNPPLDLVDRCAATEDSNSFEKRMVNYQRHDWREGIIVGQVHDENANFLEGVAGNAGLFSTASDLAKYCEMILTKGEKERAEGEGRNKKLRGREGEGEKRRRGNDEKCLLDSESVKLFATNQTPNLNENRSLGWIILEDGTMFHTGFTGTAVWRNPKLSLFAILLTNRVHPDASRTGIVEFRKRFYGAVLEGGGLSALKT